jgi:hypothetical protein
MKYSLFIYSLTIFAVPAYGFYEGTVHWEPNPDPTVVEMRIYQISNSGENIAGYTAFPYSNLTGTFTILDGCAKIYGKAYTTGGELSSASNTLVVPCVCNNCKGTITPPLDTSSSEKQDGRITALSEKALTFNVKKGRPYTVQCCTNLASGNWEFLTTLATEYDGQVNYAIDTSEHRSCFYRVIPQ